MANVQHASLTDADLHTAVRFVQAADPAASAVDGDLWFDTDDNRLRLRVSSAWQLVNVDVGDINATGSPGASTFLRGDGAWAAASGAVGPFPHWTAGRHYGVQFGMAGIAWTGAAVTADRLYACPMLIPQNYTLTAVGIGVGTAAGNVHMGLYEVGTDGLPAALVFDGGSTAISGTGSITDTISQAVSAGWYYAAAVFSATPTVQMVNGTPSWDPMGATNINTGATNLGVYKSHTFGALPNPFGGSLTYATALPKITFART